MSDYGCYTTVRIERDGGVLGWDLHLRRLMRDSAILFDRAVMEAEVTPLVRRAIAEQRLPLLARVAVTARDHALVRPGGRDLRVAVTMRPVHDDLGPLAVHAVPHRRALPDVKHLGITGELLARRRAQANGYDDALFVADGAVTEGPTWSLAIRLDGEWVAPSGGLPSTTLDVLRQTVPIRVRRVAGHELDAVEAAAALNAGWGVRPIARIDDRPLDGPGTEDLSDAYAARQRARI